MAEGDRVEVFYDPPPVGTEVADEGEFLVGIGTIDDVGSFSVAITLPPGETSGCITATVTNQVPQTSEYSAAVCY